MPKIRIHISSSDKLLSGQVKAQKSPPRKQNHIKGMLYENMLN